MAKYVQYIQIICIKPHHCVSNLAWNDEHFSLHSYRLQINTHITHINENKGRASDKMHLSFVPQERATGWLWPQGWPTVTTMWLIYQQEALSDLGWLVWTKPAKAHTATSRKLCDWGLQVHAKHIHFNRVQIVVSETLWLKWRNWGKILPLCGLKWNTLKRVLTL